MASTSASAAGGGGDDEAEYEISDDHRAARERHERAVQELLQRRRAYAMAVPTNDSAVRARLRRLGEPITLFGEREMERRDRLRTLMVRLEADGQVDRLLRAQEDDQAARAGEEEEEEEQIQYPFFTEGTQELLNARVDIAQYSLPRAKARIERAKRRHEDPDEDPDAEADLVVKQAAEFVLDCSEIGDDRPLTGCSFSRDASLLATRYFLIIMQSTCGSVLVFLTTLSLVGWDPKNYWVLIFALFIVAIMLDFDSTQLRKFEVSVGQW
jgi:U4/U6 small nuclear ribonucleoprotein PRP4